MDLGGWLGVAGGLVSAACAVVSVFQARKSKEEREAAEKIGRSLETLADAVAEEQQAPPWDLHWVSGDTYGEHGSAHCSWRRGRMPRGGRGLPDQRWSRRRAEHRFPRFAPLLLRSNFGDVGREEHPRPLDTVRWDHGHVEVPDPLKGA